MVSKTKEVFQFEKCKMEILEPGYSYHIYNHANGCENLFRCDDNYQYFLKRYEHYIAPIVDTLAYCLMPNHFHLLVRIKKETDLRYLQGFENLGGVAIERFISKQFSNFFNSYSKAFNKMYSRKGSLFNQNFRRKRIKTEENLKNAIAYIHLNPVHHEFVTNLYDWKYSSYHSFFSFKQTLVKKNEILKLFNDLENFKYHQHIKNLEFHNSVSIEN